MKHLLAVLLIFASLFIVEPAIGQDQIVGKTVYLLKTCEIRTRPIWKGEIVETAGIGKPLVVLAIEEKGYWYKVKTREGKEGYVAAKWVAPDKNAYEQVQEKELKTKTEKVNKLIKKYPSWSKKEAELIVEKKVKIGMNTEQCREAWGNPSHIKNTITANNDGPVKSHHNLSC